MKKIEAILPNDNLALVKTALALSTLVRINWTGLQGWKVVWRYITEVYIRPVQFIFSQPLTPVEQAIRSCPTEV